MIVGAFRWSYKQLEMQSQSYAQNYMLYYLTFMFVFITFVEALVFKSRLRRVDRRTRELKQEPDGG